MNEIYSLSASEIAQNVQQKNISPLEVVNSFLSHIDKINPIVNAIVTLTPEHAVLEAREATSSLYRGDTPGPLAGVPLLVKDNVYTSGIRTTFGSKLYEEFIPEEDAILVKRLKAAGSILIGKTNLPEFGMLPITDNSLFGPTFNPWDLNKTCGGSSGGSAAAVAAGMGPIATGNDAGGSIRLPAGLCGVYAIKPSFGRIPSYPKLDGFNTLLHEGPITRTVYDAALMLDVMSGPDRRDRSSLVFEKTCFRDQLNKEIKKLKIAYSPDLGYLSVDPEVEEIVKKAAFLLAEAGCLVEEVKFELPNLERDLRVLTVSQIFAANEDRLDEWKNTAHHLTRSILTLGEKYTNRDVVRVEFRRELLWDKLSSLFEEYDILLTPTSAVAAFDIKENVIVGPDQINGLKVGRMAWAGYTLPFNFTGQPAASVPCGFTAKGLPVGMQIVGRLCDDLSVLNVSLAFEDIRPWAIHRPNI